MYRYSPTN